MRIKATALDGNRIALFDCHSLAFEALMRGPEFDTVMQPRDSKRSLDLLVRPPSDELRNSDGTLLSLL